MDIISSHVTTISDAAEFAVKCPKCNAVHSYKPVEPPSKCKALQVFHSGQLRCSSSDCGYAQESASGRSMFALGCGHLLCLSDFKQVLGKTGEVTCPTCSRCNDNKDDSTVERPCSHGARVILVEGKEQCPVCFEEDNPFMIALSCGHLFCTEDFEKIGGKIGEEATLSLEELTNQRHEEIGSAIKELLEDLSEEDLAPERALEILKLLSDAACCDTGNTVAFVQHGGAAAIFSVLNRFSRNQTIHMEVLVIAESVLCDCRDPQEQALIAQTFLHAGATTFCIKFFEDGIHYLPMLRTTFELVQLMFRSEILIEVLSKGGTDLTEITSLLRAYLDVVRKHPVSLAVQGSFASTVTAICQNGNRIQNVFAELDGIEAVIAAMERFREQPVDFNEACIAALFFTAHNNSELVRKICDLGGIDLACAVINQFTQNGDLLLWGCRLFAQLKHAPIDQKASIEETIISNNVIRRLWGPLARFPDDKDITIPVLDALACLVGEFKTPGRIAQQAGFIELVVKAINTNLSCSAGALKTDLLFYAVDVLSAFERSATSAGADEHSGQIFLALATSDAIPALEAIDQRVRCVMRGEMEAVTFDASLLPGGPPDLSEMALRVLSAMGVQDKTKRGDEDNDSLCDIQSPPFTVTSIMGQDLTTTAPGWYKSRPFAIDGERSRVLAEKYSKTFLCFPSEPQVRQLVAIHVAIPFGGRGYLYGEVNGVYPAPSSGKVKATVSLSSPYLTRKPSFQPLPEFFGGEENKFDVMISLHDKTKEWEVAHITKH